MQKELDKNCSNSCPWQPKINRYMCSISSSQTNREAIIPSPRPPTHTQGWFTLVWKFQTVNSDEIQSVVRPVKQEIKRRVQGGWSFWHKNRGPRPRQRSLIQVRGKFQRYGFHLVTLCCCNTAAVNKSTLRHCNTAAVYRSISDFAHRLKTTTTAIIEALMARAENYLHNDPLFINTCLN